MKNIASAISREIAKGLPGLETHSAMFPPNRKALLAGYPPTADTKICAVMILLFKNSIGQTALPLIQRPAFERGAHGGQISFPGGKKELTDADLAFTAIRETREEIGIHIPAENIIGRITDIFIPPSNSLVTPYIAYMEKPPIYTGSEEVESVLETTLTTFMNPENIKIGCVRVKGGDFETPYYGLEGGQKVWGATAMMLAELVYICRRAGINK